MISNSNEEICNAQFVIHKGVAYPQPSVAYNDETFICLISDYRLQYLRLLNKYGVDTEGVQTKIIEELGEENDNNNPILIVYKIK